MGFNEYTHPNGSGAAWVELGEGISGDYNPSDPNDIELLRLDLFLNDNEDIVSYFSYCTQLPVSASQNVKEALLMFAAGAAWAVAEKYDSLRKVGEGLSWLDDTWLDSIIYNI